jgi:hypothetical protein
MRLSIIKEPPAVYPEVLFKAKLKDYAQANF